MLAQRSKCQHRHVGLASLQAGNVDARSIIYFLQGESSLAAQPLQAMNNFGFERGSLKKGGQHSAGKVQTSRRAANDIFVIICRPFFIFARLDDHGRSARTRYLRPAWTCYPPLTYP